MPRPLRAPYSPAPSYSRRPDTPSLGAGAVPAEASPLKGKAMMRKYEVTALMPDGDIETFNRIAPATQAFEHAFSAFSRGALVRTDRGPVAVEDLIPGDLIQTVGNGFAPLQWKGGITLIPDPMGNDREVNALTRISADALGIGRPMSDLILGPGARVFQHSSSILRITGREGAFLPARDLIDGIQVIELTPPSPVQVFHLCLGGHHRIVMNGVEVETLHPGDAFSLGLRGQSLELFLSLFPHLTDFSDFGPLRHPRLRGSDLDEYAYA